MPAAPTQPVECRAHALAADGWIRNPAGFEIQADPPDAGGIHVGQHPIGAAGLHVDDGDRARARPELLDRVERAAVVGPIDAGLHDDDSIHVEGSMQRAHLVDRGLLGCVDARGRHRETRRIAEDVRVTVACAARHVEIDPRPRLRGRSEQRRSLQEQRAPREHDGHAPLSRKSISSALTASGCSCCTQ